MAYTYDDFVTAANKAGLMGQFSAQDLETTKKSPEYGLSMLSLKQDAAKANTAEQRLLAGEAENQLRKTYGSFSSWTDDSGYPGTYLPKVDELLGKVDGYGSFQYGGQTDYQKLLDGIVNQKPFQYDLESDPSWSAYKKAYLREGERAGANALAQASAASGGQPSSYAVTAAQQAGNYYAGQLGDMIPTLEQNAYQRYLNDFSSRLSSLGALDTDRNFQYQDWMNGYNMLQNSLGNYQTQDETEYQRYLKQYLQGYQERLDDQDRQQQDFANALALYQALGYATPEAAKILGISAGGGSGSGGGGYTGGYGGTGSGGGREPEAGGENPLLAQVKANYPEGIIPKDYWNALLEDFTEGELTAAGLRREGEKEDKGKHSGGGNIVGAEKINLLQNKVK